MTIADSLIEVPAIYRGEEPEIVPVDLDVVGILPLSRLVVPAPMDGDAPGCE